MSTDRDVTRIVRSWLEEGATALPDRVLDNVLDHLPATPQRRPMWPARRSHPMRYLRFGLAAAAIVVAAFVGINLMPDQGVGPGSTPAPSPTSSPTPAPSPTSRPTPVTTPNPTPHTGQLPVPSGLVAMTPGSYLIDDPFPLRVSLTVGDGWRSWSGIVSDGAGIYKYSPDPPNGMGIVVAIVDNVYADACDASKGLLDPPLGPTVDDLVEALSGQVRTEATTPIDISLDGYEGVYFEYTATAATETCSRTLDRWPTAAGPRQALVDEHDKVWIVDVDGTRLVIDAFSFPNLPAPDLAEIQAVVDSIQIEP